MKKSPIIILSLLLSSTPLCIGVFNNSQKEYKEVQAYSGLIEEGRYFITTSISDVKYGVQAGTGTSTVQAFTSYENTLSKPWTFKLIADNTYRITYKGQSGTFNLYMAANNSSSTAEENKLNVVNSTSFNSTYSRDWLIEEGTTPGTYHLTAVYSNGAQRHLCHKTTKDDIWRNTYNTYKASYNYNFTLVHVEGNTKTLTDTILTDLECDEDGKTPPSKTIWGNAKTAYKALETPVRKFYDAQTANKDGDSAIEQSLAKYEYIIAKYGEDEYENFMERTITPLSEQSSIPNVVATTSTLIVVVVTTLVAISLAAYFIIRNKKKTS